MNFDWVSFLRQHGIPYTTGGKHVTRGNVGVSCPWCGGADRSDHLGISLEGKGYSCWKNREEHKGVAPHRLVMALIGCSYEEARTIVGYDADAFGEGIPDSRLGSALEKMMGASRARPAVVKPIEFTPEIRPLSRPVGLAGHGFWNYLEAERGYQPHESPDLVRRYDLHYSARGPFAYRIVFPIRHPVGMVNWTGRTILRREELRYRTLSADPEKAKKSGLPRAPLRADECLWNYDYLCGCDCDTLVVLEGPFDAARVDFYGREHGVAATCIFKKYVSDDQAALLAAVRPRFRRAFLGLDPDAFLDGIAGADRLAFLELSSMPALPAEREDPAEMSREEVLRAFAH